MKKTLLLLIYVVFFSVKGQSISRRVFCSASSSGLTNVNNQYYVDYTVGESIITTISNMNIIITQGFEQPDDKFQKRNNLFEKEIIQLYPNPTNNFINISFKTNKNFINGKIVIYDTNGKNILEKKIVNNAKIFDISYLKKGMYTIQIFNNKKLISTKKLIKK